MLPSFTNRIEKYETTNDIADGSQAGSAAYETRAGRVCARIDRRISISRSRAPRRRKNGPAGESTHAVLFAHSAGVLEIARPGEAERAALEITVREHVRQAESVVVLLWKRANTAALGDA